MFKERMLSLVVFAAICILASATFFGLLIGAHMAKRDNNESSTRLEICFPISGIGY